MRDEITMKRKLKKIASAILWYMGTPLFYILYYLVMIPLVLFLIVMIWYSNIKERFSK